MASTKKFLGSDGLSHLLSKLSDKIVATVKDLGYLLKSGDTMAGALVCSSTLDVSGATTVAAITASGAIKGTSTLNVTGASTLAAVTCSGAVTCSSTLKVTGASTMAAVSATTLTASSTLAVTGATTLNSTLKVTGATTAAAITASGDVTVGSTGLKLQASDGHIVLPSGVELY